MMADKRAMVQIVDRRISGLGIDDKPALPEWTILVRILAWPRFATLFSKQSWRKRIRTLQLHKPLLSQTVFIVSLKLIDTAKFPRVNLRLIGDGKRAEGDPNRVNLLLIDGGILARGRRCARHVAYPISRRIPVCRPEKVLRQYLAAAEEKPLEM